eukprot:XP_011662723.1 PREDICTED: telomeric repeat-binding factor 2-interacting protein 1 isoform X2 [Strongylocentrotus purpuratus]
MADHENEAEQESGDVSYFSSMLFTDQQYQPMVFFMRPSATRARLKLLIESGGGRVTSRHDPSEGDVIKILADGDEHSSPDCLLPSYIDDCVAANSLLDKFSYRAKSSTKEEQSTSVSEVTVSVSTKGRSYYTAAEDKAILEYIAKHPYQYCGNKTWQRMEIMKITNHSWQSMRDHFLKKLEGSLNKYTKKREENLLMKQQTDPDSDEDMSNSNDEDSNEREIKLSSDVAQTEENTAVEQHSDTSSFDMDLFQAASEDLKDKNADDRRDRGIEDGTTSSPRRTTSSPKRTTSSPRCTTSSPKRTTSFPRRTPRHTTSSPRRTTSSPRRTTSSPRRTTASPKHTTLSSRPTPRRTTSSPRRTTSSPRRKTPSPRRTPRRTTSSPRRTPRRSTAASSSDENQSQQTDRPVVHDHVVQRSTRQTKKEKDDATTTSTTKYSYKTRSKSDGMHVRDEKIVVGRKQGIERKAKNQRDSCHKEKHDVDRRTRREQILENQNKKAGEESDVKERNNVEMDSVGVQNGGTDDDGKQSGAMQVDEIDDGAMQTEGNGKEDISTHGRSSKEDFSTPEKIVVVRLSSAKKRKTPFKLKFGTDSIESQKEPTQPRQLPIVDSSSNRRTSSRRLRRGIEIVSDSSASEETMSDVLPMKRTRYTSTPHRNTSTDLDNSDQPADTQADEETSLEETEDCINLIEELCTKYSQTKSKICTALYVNSGDVTKAEEYLQCSSQTNGPLWCSSQDKILLSSSCEQNTSMKYSKAVVSQRIKWLQS